MTTTTGGLRDLVPQFVVNLKLGAHCTDRLERPTGTVNSFVYLNLIQREIEVDEELVRIKDEKLDLGFLTLTEVGLLLTNTTCYPQTPI